MKQQLPLLLDTVNKSFDGIHAVKGVSFEVQPGEVFGLLGPNGAGKTTCVSMITTLVSPCSGTLEIFGTDVTRNPNWCKQQFGVVPQETISHGFFTVEEVIQFQSGYYGVKDNQAWINELIERVGLSEYKDRRVNQLSGGMKRRVGIVKALVHKPRLLLLDEPTAGVDVELRDSLWKLIRELQETGVTILLTTHYLREAEALCDKIAIIDKGQILKNEPTKSLVQDLTSRILTLTLAPGTPPIESAYLISQDKDRAYFRLPNHMTFSEFIRRVAIPQQHILDIHIREGSLEDAFRTLLRSQQDN